jgi:uncharacterized protein (TIGR03118 family)
MKTFLRLATIATMALSTGALAFGQNYVQTDLVSNTSGVAPVTDPQLVNAWGLSRSSSSVWWVSDEKTGFATLYNGAGTKQSLVVTIPPADPANKQTPTGSPTGTIFNSSPTDFLLAAKTPATFLFATHDGAIAAWNANLNLAAGQKAPSTHAEIVAKGTKGSAYTGLTSVQINGKRFLYAANFALGRVDVFNNAFQPVKLQHDDSDRFGFDQDRFGRENKPFTDEFLPANFSPFNVQAIGNDIVVTYALHDEGSAAEIAGPGLGFVDLYSAEGKLLQRFEHGDFLNAPWGVALAPLDFGRFSHDLLVGQFAGAGTTQSSGFIAAYDLATGKFEGLLEDATGKPLAINGIWSLSPANVAPANADAAAQPAAQVYFTAGPNGATQGLFGYLTAVTSELIQGNAQ